MHNQLIISYLQKLTETLFFSKNQIVYNLVYKYIIFIYGFLFFELLMCCHVVILNHFVVQ